MVDKQTMRSEPDITGRATKMLYMCHDVMI